VNELKRHVHAIGKGILFLQQILLQTLAAQLQHDAATSKRQYEPKLTLKWNLQNIIIHSLDKHSTILRRKAGLRSLAPEVKVLRVVALKVSRDADELNHVGMGKVVHDVKLLMLFQINIRT
jgi:hypothetical protein